MLRLLLLRHAKSSWSETGQPDYDRPLNGRGRQAAPAMAAFMAGQALEPGRILCSGAQRAKETLALMLPLLPGDCDICVSRRLYEADATGYLDAIREYALTAGTVMLIAHNPAMEELAHILAPVGDAPSLRAMKQKYPTTGLAVIDFEEPRWSEIGPGGGRLTAFHTPAGIGLTNGD